MEKTDPCLVFCVVIYSLVMPTHKFTFRILFSILIFLVIAPCSFASARTVFGRYHVQRAVDEFCRVLMLNPRGKTVQKNLSQIISHSGLTALQKSDAIFLEDILGFIENLKTRIDYLVSKRDFLKRQLIANGHDQRMLQIELLSVEKNIFQLRKIALSYKKEENLSLQDPQNQVSLGVKRPLVLVNRLLVGEKEHLSMRLEALRSQYVLLKDVGNDRWGGVLSGGHLEGVKKELGPLYVQLDNLEERAEKKDIKIDRMLKQVIDLSLRLSETQMFLNEKIKEIISIKGELRDVEQRFKLGERIIQEKDDEMQSLLVKKNAELKEINGILNIYKQSLGDVSRMAKDKSIQIAFLKDELVRTRKNLKTAHRTIGLDADRMIGDDEKLIEISGILNIYKDKLKTENRTVVKKMASITALEQQLALLQNKLQAKSRELFKTRHDLIDLGDRLTVVRNELLDVKKTLGE